MRLGRGSEELGDVETSPRHPGEAAGPGARAWLARAALPLALVLTTGLIHAHLVLADPVLQSWDDAALLQPLQHAPSLRTVFSSDTLDVQPLRDLSYLLDVWFASASGISSFHLANLLMWWAILWALAALLGELRQPLAMRRWAVALFAVHPLFVQSVGWIAARKHLLAMFFIVLATRSALRLLRSRGPAWRGAAPAVFFALAMAAHPLALLWPTWFLAVALKEGQLRRREVLVTLAVLGATAAAVLVLNLSYYSGTFLDAHGNAPKVLDLASHVDWIPLMIGRYAINLLIPFDLAAVYRVYAWPNLLGIGLAVSTVSLALALLPSMRAWTWLWFIAAPLVPVTFNVTPVFVLDPYLLIPAVGVCVVIIDFLRTARARWTWRGWALTAHLGPPLLFVLLAVTAAAQTRHWLSDRALWQRAATVQPDPNSLRGYVDQLLREPIDAATVTSIRDALTELGRMPFVNREREVAVRALRLVLALETAYSLSVRERILLIEELGLAHYQTHAALGRLLEEAGERDLAYGASLRAARLGRPPIAGLTPLQDVRERLQRLGSALGRAEHLALPGPWSQPRSGPVDRGGAPMLP